MATATTPLRKIDALPEGVAPLDFEPEGFDAGFAYRWVEYRGTRYKLTELGIDEFDKIEKSITVEKEQPDGSTVESFNEPMRDRMMLGKSIVEPAKVVVGNLPTRLFFNLRLVMQGLHWGIEPDGLKKKPEKAAEETPKGN